MRIVLCAHQLPRDEPGGVGFFTANLAAELVNAGNEVALIVGSSRRPTSPPPGARVVDRRRGTWLVEEEPAAVGVRTLRL